MSNRPLLPVMLLAAACSNVVQKANVPDKVTTLQVPHTAEECDALAKKEIPKGKCKGGGWFSTHLSEVNARAKEIESYTPDRGWFVKGFTYDHVKNAISPSARKDWLTGSKALEYEECPNLQAAFCRVAKAAEEKLPQYVPDMKTYAFHNKDEEKLMMGKIEELEAHTIFAIGLQEKDWQIETNRYGIPTSRYKHGVAWVRYAPDDHPFCRAYYINVIQDHAGGGTYGETYATFIEDDLVGCPSKS